MATRQQFQNVGSGIVLCCATALSACHHRASGPVLPKPDKAQVDVGYGKQDARDVAGQVGSANAEKLMANSPRTVTDMLVGRFPGVEVYKRPNGGTSIRIRGSRSMKANDEPLLVVDGMPQSSGMTALNDLDPHDIRSIEVLKGSTAAVYGARSANGVILIATRKSP